MSITRSYLVYISYHFGKTPDGKDFGSFMGTEKFDEVSTSFDSYLDAAFGKNKFNFTYKETV